MNWEKNPLIFTARETEAQRIPHRHTESVAEQVSVSQRKSQARPPPLKHTDRSAAADLNPQDLR